MHTYNQYQVIEVSVSSYWVIQTSVWHDRKKSLTILKRKIVWCCFWILVSTNSQKNYLERFSESKAFRNFRLYEIMLKILGNHLNSFRAMYPLTRKKEYVHTVVSSARDTGALLSMARWATYFFPQRVNRNIGILQFCRNY